MLTIVEAKYLSEYKIEIKFNNGKIGIVDFQEILKKQTPPNFQTLLNIEEFKKFTVNYTLCWREELDIAPEFLFFKSFESDSSLYEQFREWGYVS